MVGLHCKSCGENLLLQEEIIVQDQHGNVLKCLFCEQRKCNECERYFHLSELTVHFKLGLVCSSCRHIWRERHSENP
jgi:hypothetical protein